MELLLVDDNPKLLAMTREFLTRELGPEQVTIETTTDPASAADVVAQSEIECVVCDYEMPVLNGIDVLERVRARRPDLPFVLYTGRGNEQVASEAIAAGITAYHRKRANPDHYAVLANKIENAVSRYRAESDLERSERRYRILAENFPNGTVALFDRSNEYVLVNGETADVFGLEVDDITGRRLEEVFPESISARLEAQYEAALAGDAGTCELSTRGRHFRVHTAPVTDYGDRAEPFGLMVTQDVTDETRNRRRLETLIDNIPGIVYRCRNTPEWPMTFVAGNCRELTGYTASEVSGEVSWGREVVHSDDWERVQAAVESALQANEPFEVTYRIRTKGGEERWVWERGQRIEAVDTDADVLEGYVMDLTEPKRRERLLSTLHEVTQQMMAAETRADICAVALDAATEILGLELVGLFLLDRETYRLVPVAYTDRAAETFETVPSFERGEGLAWDVFTDGELRVYDDPRGEHQVYNERTPAEEELIAPLGTHGVLMSASTDGAITDATELLFVRVLCNNITAALDRAGREETLLEREAELAAKNDELETVNHINTLTRTVMQTVARVDSRRTIEETVCETLAATSPYRLVWIGRYDFVDDAVEPAAHAGIDRSALESYDTSEDATHPVVEAVRTQRPSVTRDVLENRRRSGLQREALEHGYQAIASIPLVSRGRLIGVITLCTDRSDAFGDRELEVLTELGESIGYAIDAANRNAAFQSDGRTEVTLSTCDPSIPFVHASNETGARFVHRGVVIGDDDTISTFVTVSTSGFGSESEPDADLDDVLHHLREHEHVSSVRPVAGGGDGDGDESLLELVIDTPLLTGILAHYGASVTELTAESGTCECTLVVPKTVGARTVYERLASIYADVEFVKRRDIDPSAPATRTAEANALSALTDRQQELLQAAYFGGFFDTPRGVTGVDLADTFGIDQSTVHEHLRAAQRNLCASLLDGELE